MVLYLLLRSGSVTKYKHVTGMNNSVRSLYFIRVRTIWPLDISKHYEFFQPEAAFFKINSDIIPAAMPRSSKRSVPSRKVGYGL